jgi:hypothetical protein
VAILIVLSNWRFWLQQVVDYAQKAITYYNERLRRNGIRRDAHIISPKTLKQKIFSRRPQKATLPMPWDIENGAEKAKAG